jgi:alpha-tubulin suppressor-like RCC1 family protein
MNTVLHLFVLSLVAISSIEGGPALYPLSGDNGHACYAVNGVAKCWGKGSSGELGDGGSSSSNTPVAVSGLTNVESTCNGDSHACFLQSGRIHCTGSNAFGQIGNAQFSDGRWSFLLLYLVLDSQR